MKSVLFLIITLLSTTITHQYIINNEKLLRDERSVVKIAKIGNPQSFGDPNIEQEEDSNNDCVCIAYYLCDGKNKTIKTDGVGLIDVREKPKCNHYMEVCCNKPEDQEKPKLPPPQEPVNTTPRPQYCGIRNSNGLDLRILGFENKEAQYGEFPWMIALLVRKGNSLVYQCGGSLIHPRAVLTAAHCVYEIYARDETTLVARAGEYDAKTTNERFPHKEQNISQILIHENFHKGNLRNDIALLITEAPFELNDYINVVCLPDQNANVQENIECTATGWGKDEFGREGKFQVFLKKVDLPMVSRDRCQLQLRETDLGQYFHLDESFVCAGGLAGGDTCQGDGGGPLVCPEYAETINSSFYVQTGIVSWGVKSGTENVPGVYVNVALFRDWIDKWMRLYKFHTVYYG